MRVVFPDCTQALAALIDDELRAIVPGLEIRVGSPGTGGLARALADADGAILFGTKVTDEAMAALPRLRVIAFLSTGIGSWVDLEAARARGIAVRRVVGYCDATVAEHALALMLACMRRIAAMDRELRAGRWRGETLGELGGLTLGVIGLGGTGRATARLGAALGMRVLGWNRGDVAADIVARRVELATLLAESDIVSLHLALDESTRGFIGARELAALRPGAILVNTARGGLVDEAALVEALRSGHVAAAGLDVFVDEPIAADHPLLALDTVVATAHAAWQSPQAMRRLLQIGFAEMRDALDEPRG